jgi:SAM-dependent methyltransferase
MQEKKIDWSFRLNCWVMPTRFQIPRAVFGANKGIRVLDIGCGNHSPFITKRWFPNCEYHGADIQDYGIDEQDRAHMDRFFPLTFDGGGYEAMADDYYDLVFLNHVTEHMPDPAPVVEMLCRKLRTGGIFWIAFPSLKSLSLPSADGTLHFCDDPTHVRVCDVREFANIFLRNRLKIVKGGRSFNWPRFVIGLVLWPLSKLRQLVKGRMSANCMWYLYGFEDCVAGQKLPPVSTPAAVK